ncbi:replication protein [Terribacillus halophilus]|uniref:replication protein n=1 Tax=Terribacillus halophilus TaxID=361279 RepID=UPI003982185E
MASPQLEKGFTRIANELMEKMIKQNLNGTQFRIVMAIWRYTYGFQKTEKALSISYLAKQIDANRNQVDRALNSLIAREIVKVVGEDERKVRVLQVNKHYNEWLDSEPSKGEVKLAPKKDTAAKKKPAKKPKYDEDNQYYKMAVYFFKRVEKVAAEAGIAHLLRKSNMQTWADDMRKLVELNGVDKRKAWEVMDWVTNDPFWRTNILSAKKLRDKFAELAIKMNAEQKKSRPAPRKPDPRDREIALQQWISEGKDPDEFEW